MRVKSSKYCRVKVLKINQKKVSYFLEIKIKVLHLQPLSLREQKVLNSAKLILQK
jgi:hypothetical protein